MNSVGGPLGRLFATLGRRRRLQLVGVMALTLVGAFAELASIGAVVPFLQLVAAPAQVAKLPFAAPLMRNFGYTSAEQLLLPAGILLIVTAIICAAVRMLLTWANFRFVAAISHDLALKLFIKSIRQPYSVYISRNSSETLAAMEKVNTISTSVLVPLMQATSSAVIAIGIVALLFMVDPFTAIVAGGSVGVIYLALGLYMRARGRETSRQYADLLTSRVKTVQESLGGMRDIILDRSHGVFERNFSDTDYRFRSLSVKVGVLVGTPRYAIEALGIVLIALLALYFQGRPGGVVAAIPVLGALALGAQRLMPLLQVINLGWANYAALSGIMEDVLALIETPARPLPPLAAPGTAHRLTRAIELRDLGFDYAADVPTLRDIDLTIPRGARVGFVGQTGSGKSTLLDVVMGLLEPTAGGVYVDGVKLDAATTAGWQAQVAHVPQSIFLLDDTIAANIAFGVEHEAIDHARVRDVAQRADVAAFIESLPEGFGTRVGERGARLSGGQRQRLGIARALYKHASVLILDEATSALDDATERAVMAGIDALDRDLTILMIAHRLSTVATCDLVVRLDQGRIAAQGSYEDVVLRERTLQQV